MRQATAQVDELQRCAGSLIGAFSARRGIRWAVCGHRRSIAPAPKPGRGERLNDRLQALRLGPTSTRPGVHDGLKYAPVADAAPDSCAGAPGRSKKGDAARVVQDARLEGRAVSRLPWGRKWAVENPAPSERGAHEATASACPVRACRSAAVSRRAWRLCVKLWRVRPAATAPPVRSGPRAFPARHRRPMVEACRSAGRVP